MTEDKIKTGVKIVSNSTAITVRKNIANLTPQRKRSVETPTELQRPPGKAW